MCTHLLRPYLSIGIISELLRLLHCSRAYKVSLGASNSIIGLELYTAYWGFKTQGENINNFSLLLEALLHLNTHKYVLPATVLYIAIERLALKNCYKIESNPAKENNPNTYRFYHASAATVMVANLNKLINEFYNTDLLEYFFDIARCKLGLCKA